MAISVFTKLCQVVVVRDVASPFLMKLESNTVLQSVEQQIPPTDFTDESKRRMTLVLEDGHPSALLCGDKEKAVDASQRGKTRLGDVSSPITPDMLVTADQTLWSAFGLFANSDRDYFVVLDGRDFFGTLSFTDLLKLPGRMCLLALILQLEHYALELIRSGTRESWDVLPEQRKLKVLEVFHKKYGSSLSEKDPGALLHCTMFVDKIAIIKKRKLLKSITKKDEEVFQRAEEVRNVLAHPSSDYQAMVKMSPKELWNFLSDAHGLLHRLHDSIHLD